jgi:hypothetical protein
MGLNLDNPAVRWVSGLRKFGGVGCGGKNRPYSNQQNCATTREKKLTSSMSLIGRRVCHVVALWVGSGVLCSFGHGTGFPWAENPHLNSSPVKV